MEDTEKVCAEKCSKDSKSSSKLCEYHFDDSQFESQWQVNCRNLTLNAIPTISAGSNDSLSSNKQEVNSPGENAIVDKLVENLIPAKLNDMRYDNDDGIANLQDEGNKQMKTCRTDGPMNNSDMQDTTFHTSENGTIRQTNEMKHWKLQPNAITTMCVDVKGGSTALRNQEVNSPEENAIVDKPAENLVPEKLNDTRYDNDDGIASSQDEGDQSVQMETSITDGPMNNSDTQATRFHSFENGTIRQANEIKRLKLQLKQERLKNHTYKLKYKITKQLALKSVQRFQFYKNNYFILLREKEVRNNRNRAPVYFRAYCDCDLKLPRMRYPIPRCVHTDDRDAYMKLLNE
ncbi:uncharacterized protein LOC107226084 isoform X1 [Neodiprion lecontei]|uniref:Uncharacterized protein LOC107226084 isoform X1 n=1 Tax=Neodiprion lecontei TaxID=441921 RepID=A0ABM3G575_NEOLC|nr:uncharacterized protein LOC107226084 isoform X1 [Neodiprion lecontei]